MDLEKESREGKHKEANVENVNFPSKDGTIAIKPLQNENFDIRLEYVRDCLSITAKDRSNQQQFSNCFTQECIVQMNFNQPINDLVSMIGMANEQSGKKSNENNNLQLCMTIGYLNKDANLTRNGYNNQFVDKSQLNSTFTKNDALYMIVSLNQAFFKMDYAFKLNQNERSENEILKDLLIDLKQECNKLQLKCENLEKEKQMMRQCIRVNEGTISRLQKRVDKLENEQFDKISRLLNEKRKTLCLASEVFLSGNDKHSWLGSYYTCDIAWHKFSGAIEININDKNDWIEQNEDAWQFKISQNGIYQITCNIVWKNVFMNCKEAVYCKTSSTTMANILANSRNICNVSRMANDESCSDLKLVFVINNKQVCATKIDRSIADQVTAMQTIQPLEINGIFSIRFTKINFDYGKVLSCWLKIEKVE